MSREKISSKLYFIIQIQSAPNESWMDWCPNVRSSGDVQKFSYGMDAQEAAEALMVQHPWVTAVRTLRVWEQRFLEGKRE